MNLDGMTRIIWIAQMVMMVIQEQILSMEAYQTTASMRTISSSTTPRARKPATIHSMSSRSSSYSMADGGYIDSETQKSSDQQQEILMPDFDGRIVEWFLKSGDQVSKGEPIVCVESMETDSNGFRENMDIPAPRDGYLAARYKLEGDMVDAKQVLAAIVPDQKSLAGFVPHSSSSGGSGGKSWWATPYQPGRPDPFTAKSPLGDDKDDVITVSTSSSSSSSFQPTTSQSTVSDESPVSVIKGSMSSFSKNGPRKMVEIAPSPSDPFQSGTNSGRSSFPERSSVPPPSRLPTMDDNSRLPSPPSRTRVQPQLSEDIYERRRNNNRGFSTTLDSAPSPYDNDVTYVNADATRPRPIRNADNLKSAAVPSYGSDEQSSISSDDSRVRYASNDTIGKRPRTIPRRRPPTGATIDADIVPPPPPSYGSDVQSSIPASTNAFFQRKPQPRQRRKTRKQASASFGSVQSSSFYTSDEYSLEDPSIQSVVTRRSSLPTQSGGSMSLSENSLPRRSTFDEEHSPHFFESGEPAAFKERMDFVDYLEARGMRDSNYNYNVPRPMVTEQQQQQQYQQLQWQRQQQLQWQRQAMMAKPEYQRSIITRAKNRTPPTKYDIAASTLGGSLLGASIGIAGVFNPELGLDILGQSSALLPPVLWATMIGTVGYAGGIADNDAGYSIRHVFGLGNSLKSGLKKFVQSARKSVEKTANEALRMVSGQEEPTPRMHHVTVKTRDIVSAMEFYSLLGFESKSKFRVGQTRATWLDNIVIGAGRIELIEVPSDMLEQGGASNRRALDRVRNQELLGWNHMTLDVSDLMRKRGQGSLSEFLVYLNEKSYNQFGKGLRLAVEPQNQAIDDRIYETAFLYDPDGSMIQLMYLTNKKIEDYRISSLYFGEPTGGQGLVDQSGSYQGWW